MKYFASILAATFFVILPTQLVLAQTENDVVKLDFTQPPTEYAIIELSDYLMSNAEIDLLNSPIFFELVLTPKVDNPEISIDAELEISTDDYETPSYNFNDQQVFSISTNPFVLTDQVKINSRDLARESNVIYTVNNDQITITAESDNISYMNPAVLTEVQENLPSDFPTGEYTFRFTIHTSSGNLSKSLVLRYDRITGINMDSPADESTVLNPSETFQWSLSGYDNASGSIQVGIRISEFECGMSSKEAALESDAIIPFPDPGYSDQGTGGFRLIPNPLSGQFSYPQTGVPQLEEGKRYVWTVRAILRKPGGTVTKDADGIYQFTYGDYSVLSDQIVLALQNMGSAYNDYLKLEFEDICGELYGYSANQGSIVLDGEIIPISELRDVAQQVGNGNYEITDIQIEDL